MCSDLFKNKFSRDLYYGVELIENFKELTFYTFFCCCCCVNEKEKVTEYETRVEMIFGNLLWV